MYVVGRPGLASAGCSSRRSKTRPSAWLYRVVLETGIRSKRPSPCTGGLVLWNPSMGRVHRIALGSAWKGNYLILSADKRGLV